MHPFRISVHFLQPYSHGRDEAGAPEWPPSPLRLFQALVASAVGREVDPDRRSDAIEALQWLERLTPPEIVAPRADRTPIGYRAYVPNNAGDLTARGWSRRKDSPMPKRVTKDVRPVRLEGDSVHFEYLSEEPLGSRFEILRRAARSMTHLGWGIDMVAGDARDELSPVEGERWIPGRRSGRFLRAPVSGTFDALEVKHAQFLARLDGETLRPVSPLATFASVAYGREADREVAAWAAFRLVDPITDDRLALDPVGRTRDVAAWVRHLVSTVTADGDFADASSFVHGHARPGDTGEGSLSRLSYLPLPTVNWKLRRTEAIARVLIMAPTLERARLEWIAARIAGEELVWEDEPVAALEPLTSDDYVLRQYVGASARWSTVTPVVLPGHDDRSPAKQERLLLKAFRQAGFDDETLGAIRDLEWQPSGFRSGTGLAGRYRLPDKVHGPAFHVRIQFDREITGPLAIGSGRHRGLGTFAVDREESVQSRSVR